MTGADWVLHVDLDQFIAAVEIRRHPELEGLPVVVGGRGDPTERGVVSTASYAAREFGVGSGMPLRVAARKLPDAVFLPVDGPAYDEASAEVMATLRSLEWGGVPVVLEVLGWDEAFLGAGPGHGDLGDPFEFAARIRDSVFEATGLHCSVGIGDNKLRAKIATEFGKPRGSLPARRRELVRGDGGAADDSAVGDRLQDRKEAGGAGHRDGVAACGGGRGAARGRAGADDGTVVPPARPGRRHESGRCHPLGAARTRPGDDLPDRPGRLGPGGSRGPGVDGPGGRRHQPRGPAGGPGGDQGALQAVHHRHPEPDPACPQQRSRRCSATRRSPCSSGWTRTGPCGCSACVSRWSSPPGASPADAGLS